MGMFRISYAAELLGVSDDTVRRYIDQGILPAQTDASNRKVIDGVDLARFSLTQSTLPGERSTIRSSARNRMVGLVTSVVSDSVMSQVEIQCGPHRVVSLMSTEAVTELGLAPGELAVAVIKSTNVVVETPGR